MLSYMSQRLVSHKERKLLGWSILTATFENRDRVHIIYEPGVLLIFLAVATLPCWRARHCGDSKTKTGIPLRWKWSSM